MNLFVGFFEYKSLQDCFKVLYVCQGRDKSMIRDRLTHEPDQSDAEAVFAEGQAVIAHPRAATEVAQHQDAHSPVRPPGPPAEPPGRERGHPGEAEQNHSGPRYGWTGAIKHSHNYGEYSEEEQDAAGRRHLCLEGSDDASQGRGRGFSLKGVTRSFTWTRVIPNNDNQ